MTEKWKDIPGYEGRYAVSDQGHVKSLAHKARIVLRNGREAYRSVPECILKPGKYCKSGHLSVVLGRHTNGKPVHQLVMRTFVGEPPEGMEVLHKNGDPTDNRLCNLRYGSRTENILDVYRQGGMWRKLSIDDVKEIRIRLESGEHGKDIANSFHVTETTISSIKCGRTFSWLQ